MNTLDLLNLVMLAKETRESMNAGDDEASDMLLDEFADAYDYVAHSLGRYLFAAAVCKKFQVTF